MSKKKKKKKKRKEKPQQVQTHSLKCPSCFLGLWLDRPGYHLLIPTPIFIYWHSRSCETFCHSLLLEQQTWWTFHIKNFTTFVCFGSKHGAEACRNDCAWQPVAVLIIKWWVTTTYECAPNVLRVFYVKLKPLLPSPTQVSFTAMEIHGKFPCPTSKHNTSVLQHHSNQPMHTIWHHSNVHQYTPEHTTFATKHDL